MVAQEICEVGLHDVDHAARCVVDALEQRVGELYIGLGAEPVIGEFRRRSAERGLEPWAAAGSGTRRARSGMTEGTFRIDTT